MRATIIHNILSSVWADEPPTHRMTRRHDLTPEDCKLIAKALSFYENDGMCQTKAIADRVIQLAAIFDHDDEWSA